MLNYSFEQDLSGVVSCLHVVVLLLVELDDGPMAMINAAAAQYSMHEAFTHTHKSCGAHSTHCQAAIRCTHAKLHKLHNNHRALSRENKM